MKQGLKQAVARGIAGEAAENPQGLRTVIRNSASPEMRLRRAVVGASLVGIASMVPVVLFQTGILRRLPDPPVGNFNSNKVNSSSTAYGFGGPDAPLSLTSHAMNLILASLAAPNRARRRPWLPLLAAGMAGAQAGVAAKYLFHQMPKVDQAWCPYCITDALAHMATFALTLPEAGRALSGLIGRRH